jgi:hypothetical protein
MSGSGAGFALAFRLLPETFGAIVLHDYGSNRCSPSVEFRRLDLDRLLNQSE